MSTVDVINNELEMKFTLMENGVPSYQMTYKGQEVIKPSRLGFDLKKEKDLLDGFEISGTDNSSFDETWKPV